MGSVIMSNQINSNNMPKTYNAGDMSDIYGEACEYMEWLSTLAEIASKYLKKGGKVYVEGSLRTRKWKDQSGLDREVTEVRADELQLL